MSKHTMIAAMALLNLHNIGPIYEGSSKKDTQKSNLNGLNRKNRNDRFQPCKCGRPTRFVLCKQCQDKE